MTDHTWYWPNHRLLAALLAIISCSTMSGCAVLKATQAPEKKDLGVLKPGVARSRVIAELGAPVHESMDKSGHKDVFSFKQGYSSPVRAGRAGLHAIADVLTFGLWEVVGTPLEGSLDGKDVRAEVRYDEEDRVVRVEYFSGSHLAEDGPEIIGTSRPSEADPDSLVESNEDQDRKTEQPSVRQASHKSDIVE